MSTVIWNASYVKTMHVSIIKRELEHVRRGLLKNFKGPLTTKGDFINFKYISSIDGHIC
jgi:hypothetical protein